MITQVATPIAVDTIIYQILKQNKAPMHIIDILVAVKRLRPDVPVDLHKIEKMMDKHTAFIPQDADHTYGLKKWDRVNPVKGCDMYEMVVDLLRASSGPMHFSLLLEVANQQKQTSLASLVECVGAHASTFRIYDKGFVALAAVDYPRSEMVKLELFTTATDYVWSRLQGSTATPANVMQAVKGRIPLTYQEAELWVELNGH
jgi:hypothetical protein